MSAQREFSDGEVIPGTRYRVVTLIGAGGMGSVYEVEHVELGKRFVLKALLRSLTSRDDLVHRLRNEWRALGKLEHPNIVSVTDAGVTATGMPYFVMERLQGETLAVRLRRDRRLPVRDALHIAADVLDGLSAAHRIGVVHRDVKPPNVFLVAGRTAKLLDFGIAKVLDPKASQITGRGIAIGTPRYMAPEQATGEPVDARTDLYAVGLILFEMVAGTGPFDGLRDSNEQFLAHIAKTPPVLSSLAPFAPGALDPWLARLLAKKPGLRPADAASVAAALRALAEGLVPAPKVHVEREDPTLDGGPFDTLEAAQTVASGGSHEPVGGPSAVTRTGLGVPVPQMPDARSGVSSSRSAAVQSGATLRLDALTPAEQAEAPTRTSAPAPVPLETPPPVSDTASPKPQKERHWARGAVVAVSLAALGAGVFVSVRNGGLAPARRPEATAVARSPSPPAAAAPAPQPAGVVSEPKAAEVPSTASANGNQRATRAAPPAAPEIARSAGPTAVSAAVPSHAGSPQKPPLLVRSVSPAPSASALTAAGPVHSKLTPRPASRVRAAPAASSAPADAPLPASGL